MLFQPRSTQHPLAACKDRLAAKGYRCTVIRKDGKTICICTPSTNPSNAHPHVATKDQ